MRIRRGNQNQFQIPGSATIYGGGSFQPRNLPGLTSWWDFSDITTLWTTTVGGTAVTADGDVIGAVDNKSSAADAIQGTASEKPRYKTGIQGGHSAGLFDVINDFFDVGASAVIPATADWAIYGVFATGADVTTAANLFAQYVSTAGNGRILIRIVSSTLELFLGNDATESTILLSCGAVAANTTYVFSVRRESKTFTGRINGSDATAQVDSGTRSILAAGVLLGARSTTGAYNNSLADWYNKYMMELVVQVATPTAGNLVDMDNYLNGKYAVY